jgi:hypothetical protein|tara:strand:- start:186 stop:461 length:276 start_codon:yes stop_codon:yes gene_type:complete
MKLNRFHKKIIQGIIDSRKSVYETPRRNIKNVPYKACKEYNAALELMLKGKIRALSTNELEMEGPATPDPEFRWFTCRPWKTKRELKKLLC